MSEKEYRVLYMSSETDCDGEFEFATEQEALDFFNQEPEYYFLHGTKTIILEGPQDLWEERENPAYQSEPDYDWRNEEAMQRGMGLGVQAYNEVMGWD